MRKRAEEDHLCQGHMAEAGVNFAHWPALSARKGSGKTSIDCIAIAFVRNRSEYDTGWKNLVGAGYLGYIRCCTETERKPLPLQQIYSLTPGDE